MASLRYQVLAPMLAGEGSRAFLGLRLVEGQPAHPAVLVWLPEASAKDLDLVAQLQRETLRASYLEHPHITRVFELAQLEEGPARVVEYVDGESLRGILKECGKLPPLLAARLIADAASGVHYAHMAGNDDGTPLLHGDLRPDTLMLSYDGVCKVSGYGALAVAPREGKGGRRVKHRRLYSTPEQVYGGRNAIDRASDVFLLGLSLYECLSGRAPFFETADLERAVLHAALPRLRGDDGVEALNGVVQRATAKRAAQRYPSALAFREAIEDAVDGLPSHGAVAGYLMNYFVEERPARQVRQELLGRALQQLQPVTSSGKKSPPRVSVSASLPLPSPREATRWVGPPDPTPRGGISVAATSWSSSAEPPTPAAPGRKVAAAKALEPSAGLSLAPETPLVETLPGPERVAASLSELERTRIPPARRPTVEWTQEDDDDLAAEEWQPPSTARWVAAASVGVLLVLGWVLIRQGSPPRPMPTLAEAELKPVAPSPPLHLQPVTPTPESSGRVTQAPPAPLPAAPEKSGQRLEVTPAVDVALEGKALGRTPLELHLPPGRHLLRFTDERNGIRVFKSIQVTSSAEPVRVELQQGSLGLTVPDGATSYVNGRYVDDYSFEREPLFEGWHHVVVKWKGARWEKSFRLRAGEHVTLEADFTARQEELSAATEVPRKPSAPPVDDEPLPPELRPGTPIQDSQL